MKEGVYKTAFKLSNHQYWNVNVNIPKFKDGEKLPLIIALHWAGGDSAHEEYTKCLITPSVDSLKAITVTPSSEGLHWIHPMNENRVINMVKQIIKLWPIDQNRIIITGYSNGGIGSWEYARKYSKIFKSAIALAGSYNDSKIKIPVHIIHGDNDELFKKKDVLFSIQKSIAKGSRITTQFLNGRSHYEGCLYVKPLKMALYNAIEKN